MYLCNTCINEKNRLYAEQFRMRNGCSTMKENKMCSSFLGVYIAEKVLSDAFENVEHMPYGNPGYDFICGCGYLVDGKSSCTRTRKGGYHFWHFHIKKNTTADYFILLAFDNRESLSPLYLWMIPGHIVNNNDTVSISESTLHKWDSYKLDIDKVVSCCNEMKEAST